MRNLIHFVYQCIVVFFTVKVPLVDRLSLIVVAIMSGLRNQRQSTFSEKLYQRMKHLFPDQKEALTSSSIFLSNIYSSLGDNQKAEYILLDRIKEIGNKVKPGLAWTKVNGELMV